jgi:hypothetical protein
MRNAKGSKLFAGDDWSALREACVAALFRIFNGNF